MNDAVMLPVVAGGLILWVAVYAAEIVWTIWNHYRSNANGN